MDDLYIMKSLETSYCLYENSPNVVFIDQLAALLMLLDELEYVPSVRVLHYNAIKL